MTEAEAPQPTATVFGGATPILRVQSLTTSIDYYAGVLGFKVDWHEPGIMASVSRNRCSLMLCEGDQGNPGSWVWIGVGDVEILFAEYQTKGAKVRHPPTNYPWACEMQIQDPDGHVLRLGSDPIKDRPFGEWRDMHGDLWKMTAEGGWARVDLSERP